MPDTPGAANPRRNGAAHARDVLVVEDDPEMNELVGAYVGIAGFPYRAAFDGGAALEEVRRNPPALMVLDLMLPDQSGLEVCHQVKEQPQGRRVPIIILTALDSEESRRKGRECGADE